MPKPLSSSDLKTLNSYLTNDPAMTAQGHRFKARLYQVAAAISFLATIAIGGGTLATFLGCFGTTSMSFGAICLAIGGAAFSFLSGAYFIGSKLAEHDQEKWHHRLNADFQKIKHWTEKDVRQLYRDNNCSVEKMPSETSAKLKQINPEKPLLAMIPLIARYQFTAEKAKELNKCLDKIHQKDAEINKLPPEDKAKWLAEKDLLKSGYEPMISICHGEHIKCAKFTGLPIKIPEREFMRGLFMSLKKHEAT